MALRCPHIILFLVLLTGCERDQWDDCVTSTGPPRIETRDLPAFHSIDLDDRIDLVLDHLPTSTITVEAGRNLIAQVETEVKDGVLFIRNRNRCNWVRSFKPRITVRAPLEGLDLLTLWGTGNVTAMDTLKTPEFRIEQWGAMGTTDLTVDVAAIYVGLHTGAGDVVLRGRAQDNANLYSAMLGHIDASALEARIVNVNNSAVGDISCWAGEQLNAQIRDVGNVYYRGDPQVSSDITGSGGLFRLYD